ADGFLPRQLLYRGSRLVYSRGIATLATLASLLIIAFRASVTALIPLYAIGVFFSFTLSQAGMARRWWKIGHLAPGQEVRERGSTLRYEPGWRLKLAVNGFGAGVTLIVMLVFSVNKFIDGAWIGLVLTPTLVAIFFAIHRHYRALARQLSLGYANQPRRSVRHCVIVPISGTHRGMRAALHYALTLSNDVTAVHVALDPVEVAETRQQWQQGGEGGRLVIVGSPSRRLLG